jgi:hypothetical protein
MTQKDKKIIEDGEAQGIPIFVLTAKDAVTLSTLDYYRSLCRAQECPQSHIAEIGERIDEFKQWQKANPAKVKLPD